jgi:hypothetical protein
MTVDEVVRRLRAFEKSRALPRGETLRVRRLPDETVLVLAFVRMGGESAPWGIAFGPPGSVPEILTVPEPRTRDDVAAMAARFAPALLSHVHHPQHSGYGPDPDARLPEFQVWLPNDAHVEMLHHLAYAYTFARLGDPSRVPRLQALGRACGWLFREAQRPGQTIVMSAARQLTECYTFPAETTRQSHTGFLLAWLRAGGDGETRAAAAAEAEQQSISTNLDPAFERDELAPYVEMYDQARAASEGEQMGRAARRIHKLLSEELRRRFEVTVATLSMLRKDRRKENRGLEVLAHESMAEHRFQYRRLERGQDNPEDGPAFTPSPETDRHPSAAGSRYYVQEASQALRDTLLVHDDRELQAELVATGQAVAGTILDVRDEGEGRRTRPVWVVESTGELPLRVRVDSELCVVGLRDRQVRVRSIEKTANQRYRFEVEVVGLPTVPRGNDGSVLSANDPRHKRHRVVLVAPSMDQIARRKSRLIWKRDVPGAWLTHSVPRVTEADLPDEIAENLDGIVRGGASGR